MNPRWLFAIPILFALGIFATECVSKAQASLPGTKWGQQIELGTVGNSVVFKVQDDALTCLVLQPKNGSTPAFNCWGAP